MARIVPVALSAVALEDSIVIVADSNILRLFSLMNRIHVSYIYRKLKSRGFEFYYLKLKFLDFFLFLERNP